MEKRNGCRVLVRKSEGKRPLGKPKRSCEDNIKMDLRELVLGETDRIGTSGGLL
jgi:hypothetical protein